MPQFLIDDKVPMSIRSPLEFYLMHWRKVQLPHCLKGRHECNASELSGGCLHNVVLFHWMFRSLNSIHVLQFLI